MSERTRLVEFYLRRHLERKQASAAAELVGGATEEGTTTGRDWTPPTGDYQESRDAYQQQLGSQPEPKRTQPKQETKQPARDVTMPQPTPSTKTQTEQVDEFLANFPKAASIILAHALCKRAQTIEPPPSLSFMTAEQQAVQKPRVQAFKYQQYLNSGGKGGMPDLRTGVKTQAQQGEQVGMLPKEPTAVKSASVRLATLLARRRQP